MSARADEHFNAPLQQPHGVFASTSHYSGCTDADRPERKAAAVQLQPGQEPQVRAGPVLTDLCLARSKAPGSLFQPRCVVAKTLLLYTKLETAPDYTTAFQGGICRHCLGDLATAKHCVKEREKPGCLEVSPSIKHLHVFLM